MLETKDPYTHAFTLEHWQRRELKCDRMLEIALSLGWDETTEFVGWVVTGWRQSLVEGADVRECREWLTVRSTDYRKLNRLHDLFVAERLVGSTSASAEGTRYSPSYS